MTERETGLDVDVVVIGSGFGGSVAALRFAEAGKRVMVLERGYRVDRDSFEADADMLWDPRRHLFGMNELRPRGRTVIPWLGAALGGGSHVYAATLKRVDDFFGFPAAFRAGDLARYYEIAEQMLGATPYPDYPPYSDVRATQLLCQIAEQLDKDCPEFVESWGRINLGISFAPPGTDPGTAFVNVHGTEQRYSDPHEQSLLGGDIGAKNSLDLNYLWLAESLGAEIRCGTLADRIEPEGRGYRVHFGTYVREDSAWERIRRFWLPPKFAPAEPGEVTAEIVVVAAGSIGSTRILARNRQLHGTLPDLSPTLGNGYFSNGDYVTFMLPFRGFFWSWAGVAAAVAGLVVGWWWLVALGVAAYAGGLVFSRQEFDPDIGTTNSDYIRFEHRDGSAQGAYIEGGRYPTFIRGGIAIALSSLGLFRPSRYRRIVSATTFLRRWVPPFELIARSWPIPLLHMGRDDAAGRIELDSAGEVTIHYEMRDNEAYYDYTEDLGRWTARQGRAWYLPNVVARLIRRIEVPHNLGGACMGDGPDNGVVDHAGRVFGYDNLLVLDGSVFPRSLGPNPALTIAAAAERGVRIAIEQLESDGVVRAEADA